MKSRKPRHIGTLFGIGLVGIGAASLLAHGTHAGLKEQGTISEAKHYATDQWSFPAMAGTSQNWAGYVVQPSSLANGESSVTGSWTVPAISGNPNGNDAQWIGLGGVSSHDLLQMGTVEQMQNGQQTSYVFWEKLPHAADEMLPISPGDQISAKIIPIGSNTWRLTAIVTPRQGQPYAKSIVVSLSSSYVSGIETSAEWISEDPSNQNHNLLPLGNMGTITYRNATVNGQPIASPGNEVEPLEMVGTYGTPEMMPTKLSANGESFRTVMAHTSEGVQNIGGDNGGYTIVIPGIGTIRGMGGFNGFGGLGNGFPGFGNGFDWGTPSVWPQGFPSPQQSLQILQQWVAQQTQALRQIERPEVNVWPGGFSISWSSVTP
ncbi:G1 family glutamic endopeptidase [Sulfoacidibacillus thermotolerans]|uniref:Peptidase A4 family protein n=1 Tax=Sulfoacidibacillus thermotolerans TaxID=1765684 RepID=A0A2U3DAV5_SULT2|nr:G1 family glutamic endopeptidase [Sulfoacidibacillus thermotolerans]PWI58409.1 hypothetical protein BM613_04150 [Sulfoacidibacillus thermotolerans]